MHVQEKFWSLLWAFDHHWKITSYNVGKKMTISASADLNGCFTYFHVCFTSSEFRYIIEHITILKCSCIFTQVDFYQRTSLRFAPMKKAYVWGALLCSFVVGTGNQWFFPYSPCSPVGCLWGLLGSNLATLSPALLNTLVTYKLGRGGLDKHPMYFLAWD
jgi:hypothetical protein